MIKNQVPIILLTNEMIMMGNVVYMAAKCAHLRVTKLLLQKGADIFVVISRHFTWLQNMAM